MAVPVSLHLYDLTRGMASALSPMLLGKHIAGIWHSGLVIHGREYFYGYGISSTRAGETPFGQPDMVVVLGSTEVPPDMLHTLIADLRPRFRPDDYNLLQHNCNHFTSELAQLLTGEDIPEFVRSQADEVMSTPLGQQFAPLILQLEGITSQAHAAGFGAPPARAAAPAASAAAAAAAATPDAPGGIGGGGAAAAPPAAAAAGRPAAAAAAEAAKHRAAAAAAAGAPAQAAEEARRGVESMALGGGGGGDGAGAASP
ncbi:MAG: PPPDE putative peptidase domain-containing protein [Monoraphidium minutum]|nr:MAG: PPPDE putative peptidase domain-containing protein [Monoraphidium minutum]